MDILRPQLVWVGNRCYRKNTLREKPDYNPEDEEICNTDMVYCDEVCDLGLDIEETSRGFRLKVPVPSAYNKYIIGKRGETKRRLESETHTQIYVPKPGDGEVIVITGQEKKGLVSAKTRIDLLLLSARQRQPFTHFLSIPVTSDDIITGFDNFKDDVLLHCDGDQGLDSSIFQNPKKLHLTIGTLVLLNDVEIQKAVSVLEECQVDLISPILKDEGLTITVQGLEYMNDDPSAVDVLYAKVQEGDSKDRLQMLVDRLVDRFSRDGLVQQEYDRVKLHVTVMNTLFRRDSSDSVEAPQARTSRGGSSRARESFDAARVLKTFGDYNFGTLDIGSIHLSQRFSTGQDQYYQCVAQASLPWS